MSRSNNISNNEDIISEVAKRLEIPEYKVEFVFNFLLKYIQKLTWSRDIVAINFPYLGKLYLKNSSIVRRVKILEAKKKKKGLTRMEAIKLSKLKDQQNLLLNNTEGGTSKLKHHFTKNKLKNRNLTLNKTYQELEQFQNEEQK